MNLLGVELAGHNFTKTQVTIVVVVVVVLFFLLNRANSAGNAGRERGPREGRGRGSRNDERPGRHGEGRVVQCTRCGRNFQPEQVEVMSNGQQRHFHDERCPGCGWNEHNGDWDQKQRRGGSSGAW